MPKARANDPRFDPDHLREQHESEVEKRQRHVNGQNFQFNLVQARRLRELCEKLRAGPHPKLSFSGELEILLDHWEAHPPPVSWLFRWRTTAKRMGSSSR